MTCPPSVRVLSASCPPSVRVLSPLESMLSHSVRVYSPKKEGGLGSRYGMPSKSGPPLYRNRPGQTRTTWTVPKRQASYDASNREAAAVILADINAHGGLEAGLVRWARLVTMRGGLLVHSEQAPQPEQGVLFETSEVTNV